MKGNWSRSASFKWTKIKKRNILQAILGRERRINACECFKKVDWIKQIDFGYLHIKTSNQTSIQKYTVINCYLYLYLITVSSNHQQTANRSQDASSQYTWLQTQIAYSSNAPNPAASEADIPSCMRDVTGFFQVRVWVNCAQQVQIFDLCQSVFAVLPDGSLSFCFGAIRQLQTGRRCTPELANNIDSEMKKQEEPSLSDTANGAPGIDHSL